MGACMWVHEVGTCAQLHLRAGCGGGHPCPGRAAPHCILQVTWPGRASCPSLIQIPIPSWPWAAHPPWAAACGQGKYPARLYRPCLQCSTSVPQWRKGKLAARGCACSKSPWNLWGLELSLQAFPFLRDQGIKQQIKIMTGQEKDHGTEKKIPFISELLIHLPFLLLQGAFIFSLHWLLKLHSPPWAWGREGWMAGMEQLCM